MAENTGRYSRRTIALFGLVAVGVLIATLLYYEQVAVLYVLATVALVGLLITVAFADLERVGRENAGSFGRKAE